VTGFEREAGLLTSPEAAGLLLAALTGTAEGGLPGFTARLDDLHYRLGSEVTGVFSVEWDTPQGRAGDHLLATTADVAGPVAHLVRDGLAFAVWRHPADPRLPGLAPACDPDTVLAWLAAADPALAAPGALQLDLLSYRPLRRAVLRATLTGLPGGGARSLFGKVLRPGYDDRLVARQRLLAGAGLTTDVLARPAPGVVWSPAVPGHSLATAIAAAPTGAGLPSPQDLIDLLDRLPAALLDLPRRPSWSDRLDFHARTARQQLPRSAAAIDALADRIGTVLARGAHGPLRPSHGDFYEANIFRDGDRLWLVDVDSAGPGLREDDLACCLAHLAALPSLAPETYAGVPDLLGRWQRAFERTCDAADLRARVAAVLLSLVAGAPAGQDEARLAAAGVWLAAALDAG
jgi:hypothetical protein